MSEKIITVNLLANNHPLGPGVPVALGTNSFINVNLLSTMYPSNISYSKAYICIDSLMADISELFPILQITCQGLINNYEYITSDGITTTCEPSNILDVLTPISDFVNISSNLEYKSSKDNWHEITVGNLTNFTLHLVKRTPLLFDMIFITIKIKLIE